jgi:type IX secretion system PorP/SprF family membrane protein
LRKIQIIVWLFIFAYNSKAQDIHFSQLNQTPLLLNPASTGVYDGFYRGILNYKSQWAVMGKPYTTFMGSFDMPFENKRNYYSAYLGLGAFVFSDKAGDASFSNTAGDVSLSCIIPIGDLNKISAGIAGGVSYRSVNLSAIQWPNQYNGQSYDPNLPSNETSNLSSLIDFDVSAGLHYQFLKSLSKFHGREMIHFTAGAALFHANKLFQIINSGFSEHQYARIVVHTSLRYDFEGTRMGIVPSLLYMSQGPANEIDAGILLRIKTGRETIITGFLTESAFSAGLVYRYKDAIIPQIFFEVWDLGIGVSYDVNISSFLTTTKFKGGLEVSVKYAQMRGALYKNRY